MGNNFQYGDIIFLALVAVFVALRLRSMLGKDSGFDPREAWRQATRDPQQEEKVIALPERGRKHVEEEVVPPQLKDNQDVAAGLRAIKQADPSFSTTDFLGGSKLAFEWVVDAFAKGDRDKLRLLLADEPYQDFVSEIDARAERGQISQTTLVAIEAADITEARLLNGKATITVQFTSEQIHVLRDKEHNVVSGDPSAIDKVVDVWTFERDTNSRDPNWKIVTT